MKKIGVSACPGTKSQVNPLFTRPPWRKKLWQLFYAPGSDVVARLDVDERRGDEDALRSGGADAWSSHVEDVFLGVRGHG